jgi:hypothetical protein
MSFCFLRDTITNAQLIEQLRTGKEAKHGKTAYSTVSKGIFMGNRIFGISV